MVLKGVLKLSIIDIKMVDEDSIDMKMAREVLVEELAQIITGKGNKKYTVDF